jgi:two-component system copper resistance phosphate regulon response regulator CusR
VEDEAKLAAAMKLGLEANAHTVSIAPTGEDGFFLAETQDFDLLIVDVMLPGRDGIEIVRNLRRLGHRTPIWLLTSIDGTEDKVRGFDAGADEYLCKPFAFSELQARVRALGRRSSPQNAATLKLEDLEVDRARHIATRGGKLLELRVREFELLEYLLEHVDQVVTREMLAREVWKEPVGHTPIDNLIDVHIARLRRKIDDPWPVKLLQTVRGVGFVLRSDRGASPPNG